MARGRYLEILIGVEDVGGPDDYDDIMRGLRSIGAEVIEENEVYDE